MVTGKSPGQTRGVINCPNCGAITYSDRERCNACDTHLQEALARKATEDAKEKAERQQAEPELTSEQQAFLRRYSFGPGFAIYLFTTPFWVVPVVFGVIKYFAAGTATMIPLNAVYLLIIAWFGFPARRVRWSFNRWKSFDAYVKSESAWNMLGVLSWVLSVLYVIVIVGVALTRSAAQ